MPTPPLPPGVPRRTRIPPTWYFQGNYGRTEPDIVDNGLSPYLIAYQALFDPDTAAAEFDKYYAANESITTGGTGATDYYLIHALRQVGQQVDNAYTSIPTSAVYYNASTGKYSYVVYNPSTTQQSATVYQNGQVVGIFGVPARTTVDSHLDESLASVVLTESNPSRTISPGQTVQFTLTGYDQYGATYPPGQIIWSVNAGGSIGTTGLFTASTDAYPVTVTATSGSLSQSYTFRVGAAPVLTSLVTTPSFTWVINGDTQIYSVAGYDQYGDPFTLGNVVWSSSGGNGTIDGTGLFTASALGTGYVQASSGGLSTGTLVVVHAALTNAALGHTATASTTNGSNVPNNVTDGKTTTRWESTHNLDNQYIYVDLGKVYDLTSVNIVWENAYAKTYDVEVATDLTQAQPWSVVATPPTKTSNAADNIALTNATGRYLKLSLMTRPTNSTNGFSIYEIAIYGYPTAAGITPATVQISPGNATVVNGQSEPFMAYTFDANYDGGVTSAATWAVNGGGSIGNSTGLFGATTVGGPYTITAKVGSLTGSTGVTVTGGTSFAAWQSQNFTAAELGNSNVSGPNASPAGDGITNLMKFALNLNAKTIGTSGLPTVSIVSTGSSSYLTLTFNKMISATDITYTVEVSSDLRTWTSGTGSTTVVSTSNNLDGKTQTVVIRDLTAESLAMQRFVRLKVTTP